MRKILTIISCICFLFCFNVDSSAQVLNRFRGTLNVFASSGTSPTYIIQGFFNDQQGRYSSDSLELNDLLYISYEDGCARFRVDSILSKSGGIIHARIEDVAGVTSVFPGGIGAILDETSNNNYPGVISGISEDLNACIRQHFTELVDLAGGLNVQDGITLDLDEPTTNTVTGEVIVSDSSTNIIEILPDGLFADVLETDIQLSKEYFGVTTNLGFVLEQIEAHHHTHRDGETINFITEAGTPKPDTISAEVILSPDGGNTLEARSNGLYATGGSDFRIFEFVIGDAVIRASDTTGVTFVKSGGTGTLTLPDSVYLISLTVKGVTADLDGSNNFKVVIATNSATVNQGVSTLLAPNIDVINTAAQLGGGPNDSAPFIYDEQSSPQVQITGVSGGSVTARVINLDAFSNWLIKLNY